MKLACILKLFQNQSLESFYQLFTQTSVGPSKYLINKMIGLQRHLTVWGVPRLFPELPCILAKTLSQKFFSKQTNNQIRHCNKTFHCPLSKISLHYQTVIEQRLTVIHQLFSWASFGCSKCPINKMIGLQKLSHSLKSSHVYQIRTPSEKFFFGIINQVLQISNQVLQKLSLYFK